jgi:hypothetical protein
MDKHPAVEAWEAWMKSDDGATCDDEDTLRVGRVMQPYLRNRLWIAFMAGFRASEAQNTPPSDSSLQGSVQAGE